MRARKVADSLVALAARDGLALSNMQLQKLVYLAESAYGFLYGKPLLNESVQAWRHGPVVKPLYGQLKHYGSGAVDVPAAVLPVDDDVREVLETIVEYFASASAAKLRRLTHAVGPYRDHFKADVQDIEIPRSEIHCAWPEFLEQAARGVHRVPSRDSSKMRSLLSRARTGGTRDTKQLMDDYRAFAASSRS